MDDTIKRDIYMKKLRPLFNDPLIKVITGMRRVGKSTLLLLIQKELKTIGIRDEQIIGINYELMDYDFLRTPQATINGKTEKLLIWITNL